MAELEAREACAWLRAAGFPQYAQLFEDMQFPVDVRTVRKDHEFLDGDAIESLFRQSCFIYIFDNVMFSKLPLKCTFFTSKSDDSDDEPCAISNKWAYERCSQKWFRLESLEGSTEGARASLPGSPILKSTANEDRVLLDRGDKHDVLSTHSTSSGDSDAVSSPKSFEDMETSLSSSSGVASLESAFSCSPPPSECLNTTSEKKLWDKSPYKKRKSLLKKMEKLHLRSCNLRSGQSKAKPIISEPFLLEGLNEEKMKMLNCVNIADLPGTQTKNNSSRSPPSCNSNSKFENSRTVSTARPLKKPESCCERKGRCAEDLESGKLLLWSDASQGNLNSEVELQTNQMFQVPHGHKPGTFPKALMKSPVSPGDDSSVRWRTGCRRSQSRSRSKDSKAPSSPISGTDNRLSVYDNMPSVELDKLEAAEVGDDDVFSELNNVIEDVKGLRKLVDQWTEKLSDDGYLDFASDLPALYPSSPKEICLDTEHLEVKRAAMLSSEGEHSCELGKELGSTDLAFITDPTKSNRSADTPLTSQLARAQKLALLKLTAVMDRYSPSSKQGCNWTIPKFKKIKASDYKDKNVFGVPLLLNVQRTNHPLPIGILQALDYLRSHFLDQVGLFRKSGVRSRILSLREMNETSPNSVCYEGQSAFDVADMVKQYFRDLPEPIFTSRLCESFLHIYQYVPKDQQLQAVQAAILLLPKENREALKILLFFLRDVVACAEENQMTPTNIAVCLAPSLFHLNTLRRDSSSSSTRSSQRKCSLGKPDQRELSENLAATQGLAHMIMECNRLFQVWCLLSHRKSRGWGQLGVCAAEGCPLPTGTGGRGGLSCSLAPTDSQPPYLREPLVHPSIQLWSVFLAHGSCTALGCLPHPSTVSPAAHSQPCAPE
uniref:Rho-GAP domain-containing protein n=1 Tax=Pavo cristatus TaxID=9049 RepID=A0A8C9F443_PAVCR